MGVSSALFTCFEGKAPTQWVGTTACWMWVPQFGMMCSTYPICSGVGNDSNSGPGSTNTSDSNIPGIFDLDVGDTNWVITSSFIIFTMQTGETLRAAWRYAVLQQPTVRCNILEKCKSLPPVPPFKTSCQVDLRSILWPCRSSGGYSPVSYRVSPSSIPGQFMWFSNYFRFSGPTSVNLESSHEITKAEDLWIKMRRSRATGMWPVATLFRLSFNICFWKK